MKLDKIRKLKWRYIVNRKTSPLFLYFITSKQDEKSCKKILGYNIGYRYYVYLDGEVFSPQEDYDRVSKSINKEIQKSGYKFLNDLYSKWEKIGEDLIGFFDNLNKDFSKINNEELLSLFKEYVNKSCKLSTAIQIPLNAGAILEDKIKSILSLKLKNERLLLDYFLILTAPHKFNENEKELQSLFSIGAHIQKTKTSIEKLDHKALLMIEEHIKQFGWMNSSRYFRSGYTKKDIIERLKEVLKENCLNRLKEIKNSEKINKTKTEEIFKKLKFTEREKEIVNITKKYVFLRTFRMNTFVMSGFLARPLLSEIAKRMGINISSIIVLTPPEIIKALSNNEKVCDKTIKDRLSGYGMFQEYGKITIFTKNKIKDYRKKYNIYENIKKTSKLHGTIANKGVAKGKAKILVSLKDIKKIKTGDILVAPMTIPEMISAMQKAAAFVTDEGGILCHAAIVSREMKKPCIIGTKIATKVLKDEDLVEVDANKGIVKILKK